jgi:hypothetical protein
VAISDNSGVMPRRREVPAQREVTHRRHDVEAHAGAERLVREAREKSARRALDRDAKRLAFRRADRIRATNVDAFELRAKRQVLPRFEAERLVQLRRDIEAHDDGVAGVALDFGHRERMELAHARLSAA